MAANPLVDVVPGKYRKYVYAALSLAALGWSLYQASDGDWKQLVGGLIVSLTGATAASNIHRPTTNPLHDSH